MEEILKNCQKSLRRGRAVATGIGLYAAVINKDGEILLRIRTEKGSLFDKNLSGKWELIGGGVELADFKEDHYVGALANRLSRELEEEAGLKISNMPWPIKLLPAWLSKEGKIDLAFVVVIPAKDARVTQKYVEKFSSGEIKFFKPEEIDNLDFIGPRMKFLAKQAMISLR